MPDSRLRCSRTIAGTVLAFLAVGAMPVMAATALSNTIQEQSSIDRAAESSQNRVDQFADETRDMLEEYLLTTQRSDRLRLYNDQIEKLIRDQEEEKLSITRQMEDIEVVEQEIIPLMIKMIDALDRFIELDLPFQIVERKARVEELRAMMDSSSFTVAEKYRKVMEAYQQEVEYGRTIFAYRGTLDLGDGNQRNVDFLQVGRVLLAFQTLDRSETGFYNANTNAWEIRDDAQFSDNVDQGLRIARKQSAPNLLMLPVAAPTEAN